MLEIHLLWITCSRTVLNIIHGGSHQSWPNCGRFRFLDFSGDVQNSSFQAEPRMEVCIFTCIYPSFFEACYFRSTINRRLHSSNPTLSAHKGKGFCCCHFVHGSSIKDMQTHSDWRESTCCRLRDLLLPPISLSGEGTHHTASTRTHAHTRSETGQKLSALIRFFENRRLAEPYPRICKFYPDCVHLHENRPSLSPWRRD